MFELALRSVIRHGFRSAMTFSAVSLGVAALILAGGFVQDILVQLGEAIIHSQTGHLQIVRQAALGSGSRSLEKHLLDPIDPIRAAAADMPMTADVLMRLSFNGLLNNGRADLSIIGQGIEPDLEARVGTHTTIVKGRALSVDDRFGVLVGEGVAQALKLAPGDRVVLLANTPEGALNTLDLEVVGVFRSFSREFDARAIRVPLAIAQDLLGTRSANAVIVALKQTRDTDIAAQALRAKLAGSDVAVRTWREVDDFYDKTVELYRRQFGVLRFVVLFMVLLSVANTVNMSVFERTSEFGTMRALGNKPGQVFARIVVENALIGLAGALLGAVLAIGLAVTISAIGIPMPPPPNSNMGYTAQIRLTPLLVAESMAVGVIATFVASLAPARRASRIPIAEALRQAV